MRFLQLAAVFSLAALASPNPETQKVALKQAETPAVPASEVVLKDIPEAVDANGQKVVGKQDAVPAIPTVETTEGTVDTTLTTSAGAAETTSASPEGTSDPTEPSGPDSDPKSKDGTDPKDPADSKDTPDAPDAPDNPEVKCKSYGRGIGKIPRDCPEGKSRQHGLCYKPCDDGWKGVGPVCWKKWRSRGRGVGTVPNQCGDKENNAGLCYDKCKEGFHGIGPVCWPNKDTCA